MPQPRNRVHGRTLNWRHEFLLPAGQATLDRSWSLCCLKKAMLFTSLDQFLFGQTSLAECCINPNFQVTRGDCRDRDTMSRLMRNADYIIPLAAIVGAPACKNDCDRRRSRSTARPSSSSSHCARASNASSCPIPTAATESARSGILHRGKPVTPDQSLRQDQGRGRDWRCLRPATR